jgi:hypothetical protein
MGFEASVSVDKDSILTMGRLAESPPTKAQLGRLDGPVKGVKRFQRGPPPSLHWPRARRARKAAGQEARYLATSSRREYL